MLLILITCEYTSGCKSTDALNFNPEAVIDDGSCIFEEAATLKAQYMDVWMLLHEYV